VKEECPGAAVTARGADHERSLVIESSVPKPNARSSDQNARAFWNRERISEAVEEELARLREERPGLGSKIDRASHLLVVHLSDSCSGTIRVRIDARRNCR
jgi:hypothetical protein